MTTDVQYVFDLSPIYWIHFRFVFALISVCIWQLAAPFGFMEKPLSRAQPSSTTSCWGRGPSLDQFSLRENELAG